MPRARKLLDYCCHPGFTHGWYFDSDHPKSDIFWDDSKRILEKYLLSSNLKREEELEEPEEDFVSMLYVPIPLSFNEDFFKWFEYRRWDKVKAIFKEMKRRRGRGNALKIDISFVGNPKIRFVIDSQDSNWLKR